MYMWTLLGLLASMNLHLDSVALFEVEVSKVRLRSFTAVIHALRALLLIKVTKMLIMLLQDHSVLKEHVLHVDSTGLMHCLYTDICVQDTSAMFSFQFLFSIHFFSVKCSQYVLNVL